MLQLFLIINIYFICTIVEKLLCFILNIGSDEKSHNFEVYLLRKFLCFPKKLHSYRMDVPIHMVNIYSDSLPLGFIHSRFLCSFHHFHDTLWSTLYTDAAHFTAFID